jgi:hypothetical protein
MELSISIRFAIPALMGGNTGVLNTHVSRMCFAYGNLSLQDLKKYL